MNVVTAHTLPIVMAGARIMRLLGVKVNLSHYKIPIVLPTDPFLTEWYLNLKTNFSRKKILKY